MCHLCDERLTYANTAINEIIAVQTEYRETMTKRGQAQRVSDMANMWLHDMPFPKSTAPGTVTALQNITLFLAAMTERVMEAKADV